MKVKIRNLSDFNKETLIKISKTAKIARLKKKIKKVLAIKPILQELYYGGKHLELENSLYDYKVNKNDVIQLRVKSDCSSLENLASSTADLTKNKPEKREEEKKYYEDLENAESDYYTIGDPVDCLDFEYGAWFEATLKRICKIDSKLVYIVEWDLVEIAQHFYVTDESIRPRAREAIAIEDLRIGEKVMINHNLDRPSEIGFWYDFEIQKICSIDNRCILTGTLYIGRNNESLYNHEIVLREKVYAIEKPKLLKDRPPNNDRYANIVRRPIAPQCYRCYDKLEVHCKECSCVVCGGKNNPDLILVCDECEEEYHINCLKPPLKEIPEDDWYCAKCKNDKNEIVQVGQMVKRRPLNKCEEISLKTKKSKKRKEKSEPTETIKNMPIKKVTIKKVPTKKMIIKNKPSVPNNHRGAIPGIEVGACWDNRVQLFHSGVHYATISGIHGKISDCAYSLILSGNYNDVDHGNEFIYTGAGGHGSKGALKVPIADQTLTKSNKALALNCNAEFNDEVGATATDWRAGIPVRVIRSYKLAQFSQYAPTQGNRYDGLYKVVKYYPEMDKSGFRVWRFLLRRDDPAPPPWTSAGKIRCLELCSTMDNETKSIEIMDNETKSIETMDNETKSIETMDNETKSIETKSLKVKINIENLHEKDKTTLKKKEVEHYSLDSNMSRLIGRDTVNCKLWEHCKSYLQNGKKSFLHQVLLSFKCVCCHELVVKPVTTSCAHNICQSCLEKSFSAGLKFCPTCRFNLTTASISVNENLTKILSLLFLKRDKASIS